MKRVLLIHTGGTIGMVRDNTSGTLKPDFFYESMMRFIPELSGVAELQVEIPFILDSAEMNPSHWSQLAGIIRSRIDQIDGVVITHGTDTLAYTASALSYMLMNITIPVILTGAQKPLGELRTDARNNLINAIELATRPIQEVAIFFNDRLMRGNRTIKSHINHFDAFSSPNYPLLAEVGIDISLYPVNLLKPQGMFHVFDQLDASIAVLKLYPGINSDYFQPLPGTRGIIIIAYGAGTLPLSTDTLQSKIRAWLDQGILVCLMSETRAGGTEPELYESGRKLLEMGVLSTGDMTFEAGITKLMFLFGQYHDHSIIRRNFMLSLAGERSY